MSKTEAFSEDTYRRLFGIRKVKELEFAEGLIKALAQIDRALLPQPSTHPLGELISAGEQSVDALIDMIGDDDARKSLDAIDALGHVALYAPLSSEQLKNIVAHTTRLHKEGDTNSAALLLKVLAIAGDASLMSQQLKRLADEDPGVVASAARLLGFGRFKAAEPALRGLVSPDRIFESRAVIWALGEIGERDSLRALEYALSSGFRSVDAMIAMGKIGELTSIPKLVPMMVAGLSEQRDAAYRALAMILNNNRELAKETEALKLQIVPIIMQQFADGELPKSGSMRFHMCLCLARLGEKLDTARVKQFLNLGLSDDEAGHMIGLFGRR